MNTLPRDPTSYTLVTLALQLTLSFNLFLNLFAASSSQNCTPWLGMFIEHATHDPSKVHWNFFYLALKLLMFNFLHLTIRSGMVLLLTVALTSNTMPGT